MTPTERAIKAARDQQARLAPDNSEHAELARLIAELEEKARNDVPNEQRRSKQHARGQLAGAVLRGDITRPPRCQHCPSTVNVQAHHDDYARPLDIVWLCPRCHATEHKRLRTPTPVPKRQTQTRLIPRTIADRAMLAARRQRDRATAAFERWQAAIRTAPAWDHAQARYLACGEELVDAERTVAELERGAGVPIIMDEERGEA